MSATRRVGPLLLASRTARALARMANASLDHPFSPDPWVAALTVDRLARIAEQLEQLEAPPERRIWAVGVVSELAGALRGRLEQRAEARRVRWPVRPPALLAQQANRQLQVLGAQCNHRELLLNPIERVEAACGALTEIVAELELHRVHATLPPTYEPLIDHARAAITSMGARIERVRALRAITPPELLLAMADREIDGARATLRAGNPAPSAALGIQRRLLETELLVLNMALAFGTPDTLVTLRRVQRARRRAGGLGQPALRPSPSPAEEGG